MQKGNKTLSRDVCMKPIGISMSNILLRLISYWCNYAYLPTEVRDQVMRPRFETCFEALGLFRARQNRPYETVSVNTASLDRKIQYI